MTEENGDGVRRPASDVPPEAEPKPEAAPEAVAVAKTESVEAAPVAVEAAKAEAVVAPVEFVKTAPIGEIVRTPAEPAPKIEEPEPPKPEPLVEPAATSEPDAGRRTPDAGSSEPSPDFMLAEEAPAPIAPLPPVLPTPAEAALQAARIVSQMVDIDSESGA
ncbi:MAG: hypothetical protein ACM31C_08320, partial [Acidobacteriota bacterium]